MKNWRNLHRCPECNEKAFVVGEELSHCEVCGYEE